MLTNRSHSPLYLPLLIAICGILFSVWNALDAASVPCVSAGCTLYQNFSINGYSLWWGGVGIFSLLGLLALTGRAVLGRWLAGLAVLLDCVLLGIMILTLPCVACMVAALLLALSYITFRAATLADTHRSALRHASPLLVLWGALFLLTLGGLARSEVGPWALQAPEMEDETTARVFFSPSCSACRQLVMGMSEADARKIIWCPVAEEEKDLAIILNLKKRIEMGTPLTRSFLPSLETEPMTFWDLFSLEEQNALKTALSGDNFGSLDKDQIKQFSERFAKPEMFMRINGKITAVEVKPSIKAKLDRLQKEQNNTDKPQPQKKPREETL